MLTLRALRGVVGDVRLPRVLTLEMALVRNMSSFMRPVGTAWLTEVLVTVKAMFITLRRLARYLGLPFLRRLPMVTLRGRSLTGVEWSIVDPDRCGTDPNRVLLKLSQECLGHNRQLLIDSGASSHLVGQLAMIP